MITPQDFCLMEAPPPGCRIQPRVWRTLLQIEHLAGTWVLHGVPHSHSYGRLPDEEDIAAWSIPRSSGFLLNTLCRVLKPRCVLELGTSFAYSTIWLAEPLVGFGTVHTCEILPEKIALAQKYIVEAGLPNIRLSPSDARELTRAWKERIDLLFMDADPENYVEYFSNLVPHFSKKCLIVMDNAQNHSQVTGSFLDFMATHKDWRSWVLPQDNGLMFAIRV
jgi:predicted O-methyltransferase YrrM